MSADFLLVNTILPHKISGEGKFEVLTNPERVKELAWNRFEGNLEDLMAYAPYENLNEEFFDENDEFDEKAAHTFIDDQLTQFAQLVDSYMVETFVFDVPRIFAGGTSWGDSPSEEFDTICYVIGLNVFDKPIEDNEISETQKTDWLPMSKI
jgi:hypothetical protein